MPKRLEIPDAEFSGQNLDEHRHVQIDGYDVCEWTPERAGQGKPTEVHLVLEVHLVASFVVAFKSADAVDRMIAALMRHRNGVWGGGEG